MHVIADSIIFSPNLSKSIFPYQHSLHMGNESITHQDRHLINQPITNFSTHMKNIYM